MKFLILSILLLLIFKQTTSDVIYKHNGPPKYRTPDDRTAGLITLNEKYITQKLDHFNTSDERVWSNRYFDTNSYVRVQNPHVFIMLAGESNAEDLIGYLSGGLMASIGSALGGYMIILEHRFYGGSIPNRDLSDANLKYLTMEQAMEDTINLIQTVKNHSYYTNSKVVLFGGSYPGVLVANVRQKYPKLVHSAVSSSAPLKPVVEFKEYFEKINTSYNNISCTKMITNSFRTLDDMFNNRTSYTELYNDLQLCRPINTEDKFLDQMTVMQQVGVMLSNVIQYGDPQKIKSLCATLCLPTELDDYQRLVNYINEYMKAQHINCLGLYKDYVHSVRTQPSIRPWIYQQCTQFGDLITTGSTKQAFLNSIPVSFWENVCSDGFHINNPLQSLAVQTNNLLTNYGGNTPNLQTFTRIVSTHGSLDPWSSLGLKNTSNNAPLYITKDVSHCADLSPGTRHDPADLITTRNHVYNTLYHWLLTY